MVEQAPLYKLKITLDGPESVPVVWRELTIKGPANLTELSDAIQASFGWANIHKHEFVAVDDSWKATDPEFGLGEYDDKYQNEQGVLIQDVAKKVGTFANYNYDLTDPWTHTLEVVSIEEGAHGHAKTKLTGGARAGPPEDCGGASGYEEFLDALEDPSHPEHKAMALWYKSDCPNGRGVYDPERLEVDQINKILAAWSPS